MELCTADLWSREREREGHERFAVEKFDLRSLYIPASVLACTAWVLHKEYE